MNRRPLVACLLALIALPAACSSGVSIDGVDGDGGSGGPNQGPQQEETCVAAEAGLALAFSVSTSDWDVEGEANMGEPQTLTIEAAQCVVDSVSGDGASIALTCSDDQVQDGQITISMSAVPDGYVSALSVGAAVQLDHRWRGDGHHVSSGHWLVIQNDERVLMAVVDYDGLSSASDAIASLSLSTDDSLCEAPCTADSPDCFEGTRMGIRVQASDAHAVVLDGTRGSLESGDTTYDIFVPSAQQLTCLNCSDDYVLLIAPQ